jgi:hypothetical protein
MRMTPTPRNSDLSLMGRCPAVLCETGLGYAPSGHIDEATLMAMASRVHATID